MLQGDVMVVNDRDRNVILPGSSIVLRKRKFCPSTLTFADCESQVATDSLSQCKSNDSRRRTIQHKQKSFHSANPMLISRCL